MELLFWRECCLQSTWVIDWFVQYRDIYLYRDILAKDISDTGVGGIDKYSTSVFLEKILRYYYIPTIGVADLQAPLNNMLQTS